jgi:hypothetical protein
MSQPFLVSLNYLGRFSILARVTNTNVTPFTCHPCKWLALCGFPFMKAQSLVDHPLARATQQLSHTSPWRMPKTSWAWAWGDPGVTPETCGTVGERAQIILVMWGRGVGNASHPQRLGVIRVSPWAMRTLWHEDFRMLKNTSIRGVS